ncbi:POM121-like protein 12 [Diceros bicornis minor]|uniref:POM121-like protein 12 n=1 Tax=Diceros bicornis minor TaxID=77932 RepID=UPI0026EAA5CA|nr:POM121-like protein 12 [Diceros bicornis minor]
MRDALVEFGSFDLPCLTPTCPDYWIYSGSLTTPPLSKSITWIIKKQPVETDHDQTSDRSGSRIRPRRPRPRRTAIMGSYLGKYVGTAEPALPPPAPERRSQRLRPAGRPPRWDQGPAGHVHQQCRMRAKPRSTIPPGGDHATIRRAFVPKARKHFPSRAARHTSMGLAFSENQSFVQQCLWNVRNPRGTRGPVTVKIHPPESRGSVYRCPPPEEPPDPCAKETVLKALSLCPKGKKKFDGPLWFEIPDTEERSPSPPRRPSAFKPVWRNGVIPSFVPRPGPLRGRVCP